MLAASASGVRDSVFTQCSKCETVFRLSAEALRAAGGQVRCGRCGEVFDALARIAEDAAGFTKGDSSPLDLETRADEILESLVLEQMSGRDEPQHAPLQAESARVDEEVPPGVEMAQLHFLDPIDDDMVAETSLEFTLPPGEVDRIFIETRANSLQQLGADGPQGERGKVHLHIVPTGAPTSAAAGMSTTVAAVAPMAPEAPPAAALPPHPEAISVGNTASMAVARPSGGVGPLTRESLEVAEDVALGISTPRAKPGRLSTTLWLVAAFLLALALSAQIIRANHEWLATHVPQLLTGYATTAAANLSSYQLRQWGVTGDPGAKGMLRVRASILNTASQMQRYPLLRVSLVNRFGTRVGAREFEPSEYMGKPISRMMAPGDLEEATLDILDPGQDAEGFEIDVCIRHIDKTIICAGDAASQTR